jgi:uncharacterized protein (DUF2252 family)
MTPSPNTPLPHLTLAERAAVGKQARKRIPRSRLAEWDPSHRTADPIALLEEQAVTRVSELVPIRYGRMAVSPFTFFRGAAYVMASDLAAAPRSGLEVQLCGDAHLANLGGFASPERALVFDLNDFDETLPGPFEWDVKRLVASFEVAARDRGLTTAERASVLSTVARTYREAMRSFSEMSNLDIWYTQLDVETIVERWGAEASTKSLKGLQRTVAKAQSKDRLRALTKLTVEVDGELQLASDPPLLVPVAEVFPDRDAEQIHNTLRDALRSYRRTMQGDRRHLLESYRFVDLGRKVVGVGSVGMRSWVALLVGRDNRDPLFIQIKEAERSVLEPFLKKSKFTNHGQRVVEGQRRMQSSSDIFLGWQRVDASESADGRPHDYYMRQLWDWKASANLETMTPEALGFYAQICGYTLARAHARTGDPVALTAYLGTSDGFDRAMADFAQAYADQNEVDHAALVAAIADGTIAATPGI